FNGDGVWSGAGNWSPAIVPDGSGFDVTIDDGDSAVTVTLDGSRTIHTLTMGANDTLDIQATASSVSLSSTNGFTNGGNIFLTGTDVGTSRLSVNNGAMTVSQFGLLRFSSGTGARRMDADLVNNGTVQINKDTTFDKFLGSYTNNGSFSVTGGATLNI